MWLIVPESTFIIYSKARWHMVQLSQEGLLLSFFSLFLSFFWYFNSFNVNLIPPNVYICTWERLKWRYVDFFHNIFIDHLRISRHEPWSHLLASPLRSTPQSLWILRRSKERRRREGEGWKGGEGGSRRKKAQLVSPIFSLEHGQIPDGQPIKKRVFPSVPHQKSLVVEKCISASLPQFLRVHFDGFLSRLLLFWEC